METMTMVGLLEGFRLKRHPFATWMERNIMVASPLRTGTLYLPREIAVTAAAKSMNI